MAALLDVNALIALVDSDHISHTVVTAWFSENHHHGWATCPIAENGMVRVLSQPAYPSGQRTPAEVIDVLSALKSSFAESYQFWPDEVSLSDGSLFKSAFITGPRLVTDAYLLALALHKKGKLVSFDRSLPWQVVRGGSAQLVIHPGGKK
ncbi:MAG: PIN domain-containing protein [Acidobacteriaceae bacterium]|nr:PIN domain-containing protein [Acidobacteriaceae bacterium]